MSRPHPAINDTATDIEIAPIPKGVLLTYSLINELTGEYQRLGRTLSAIEANTIIQRHKKPPKPRKFWILRRGYKGYAGNYCVRFQHDDGRPLTDVDDFEEIIPVEEMRPLKVPPPPPLLPGKPREWFGEVLPNGQLVIHNNSSDRCIGGGAEFIHVKEFIPEPPAKEWWFVKTRYDGPWWRRCDEKQSDPENHKTQIHVREIP